MIYLIAYLTVGVIIGVLYFRHEEEVFYVRDIGKLAIISLLWPIFTLLMIGDSKYGSKELWRKKK